MSRDDRGQVLEGCAHLDGKDSCLDEFAGFAAADTDSQDQSTGSFPVQHGDAAGGIHAHGTAGETPRHAGQAGTAFCIETATPGDVGVGLDDVGYCSRFIGTWLIAYDLGCNAALGERDACKVGRAGDVTHGEDALFAGSLLFIDGDPS